MYQYTDVVCRPLPSVTEKTGYYKWFTAKFNADRYENKITVMTQRKEQNMNSILKKTVRILRELRNEEYTAQRPESLIQITNILTNIFHPFISDVGKYWQIFITF